MSISDGFFHPDALLQEWAVNIPLAPSSRLAGGSSAGSPFAACLGRCIASSQSTPRPATGRAPTQAQEKQAAKTHGPHRTGHVGGSMLGAGAVLYAGEGAGSMSYVVLCSRLAMRRPTDTKRHLEREKKWMPPWDNVIVIRYPCGLGGTRLV